MKQYEKLALQEASYQCTTGNEHFDAARHGYIAYGFEQGFLKAREMAIQEISKAYLEGLDIGQQAYGALPLLIKLGEKEV